MCVCVCVRERERERPRERQSRAIKVCASDNSHSFCCLEFEIRDQGSSLQKEQQVIVKLSPLVLDCFVDRHGFIFCFVLILLC